MTNFKNLHFTQKFSLFIPVLFIGSIFLINFINRFQYSPDLHWIYAYGEIAFIVLILGSLLWSFVNFLILIDKSIKMKKRLLWIFIDLSPILFVIIMLTYKWLRDMYRY